MGKIKYYGNDKEYQVIKSCNRKFKNLELILKSKCIVTFCKQI